MPTQFNTIYHHTRFNLDKNKTINEPDIFEYKPDKFRIPYHIETTYFEFFRHPEGPSYLFIEFFIKRDNNLELVAEFLDARNYQPREDAMRGSCKLDVDAKFYT